LLIRYGVASWPEPVVLRIVEKKAWRRDLFLRNLAPERAENMEPTNFDELTKSPGQFTLTSPCS